MSRNEVWESGEIRENFSRSLFIAMRKRKKSENNKEQGGINVNSLGQPAWLAK